MLVLDTIKKDKQSTIYKGLQHAAKIGRRRSNDVLFKTCSPPLSNGKFSFLLWKRTFLERRGWC